MGALISLFIQVIMLTISLMFSIIFMSLRMFGLLLSLLARSGRSHRRYSRPARAFAPRASSGGVSRGQTLHSPVGYLVLVIVALLIILTAFGASPTAGIVVTLVVIVAGVVWLKLRGRRGPQTATAQQLAARFGAVGSMSGAQFEVFTADMLRALGYGATVLGRSGDQGVDVIATSRDQRIAVQCKNYRKAVGNKPVQEVYAGARHHNCQQAWVVAPAGFTKGAFELAGSVGVSLFDSSSIMQWITKVDEAARQPSETKGDAPIESGLSPDSITDAPANTCEGAVHAYEGCIGILEELVEMRLAGQVGPEAVGQWQELVAKTTAEAREANQTIGDRQNVHPGEIMEEQVRRYGAATGRIDRVNSRLNLVLDE